MGRNRGGSPLRLGLAAALLVGALLGASIALGASSLASRPGTLEPSAGALPSTPVIVAPGLAAGGSIHDLGAMPPTTSMQVVVALAMRDPAAFDARLALEYAPSSPEFHKYLSPTQIAATYGPTPASYRAAVAYFAGQGLSVRTSPDNSFLTVTGSESGIARAFDTSFALYRQGSHTFFSHPTPAILPAGLPWAGAYGLGNQTTPTVDSTLAPAGHLVPATGCAEASGPYSPCEIQSAYNLSGFLTNGTNGTGYRIGIVDAYDGAEPETQLQADLAAFTAENNLTVGSVNYLYPVPTTRDLNLTDTGWGLEEALDLEWSRAMAPGATIDMTFAPDATTGLYSAIDWLVAHHSVDVISMSWGEPDVGVYNSYNTPCSSECNASTDGTYNLLLPVLAAGAAEGIGLFSSSGDCGAAEGTNGISTGYPASDPSVTGVGGTVLTVGAANQYGTEVGWSGNQTGSKAPGCQNQGGSGGGFAPFPRPWWQSAPGYPAGETRGVPDVSIVGGSPVEIVFSGFNAAVQGTSEGSPMWAGIEAIADQYAGHALGSLNPSLYALARSASYSRDFHDITTGENTYLAGAGWDPVTGLGSPNGSALVPALAAVPPGPSSLFAYLGATPRTLGIGQTATFRASAAGGVSPYAFFDISFGDGNASLTQNGTASHAFAAPGIYAATAVVIDGSANSSLSAAVAIVVGGGSSLNVTLSANATTAPVGGPVAFTAAVAGGTAPYRYSYYFGDGTYLTNSSLATVDHAYGARGGYCASVVAWDSATPADGGASTPVAESIGGGGTPPCQVESPLVANLSSPLLAADLPADFPFSISVQGGVAPYSTQLVTNDPYVRACNCGIFQTVGPHTVWLYANDSLNREVVAETNVTTYPALVAQFNASAQVGTAPFTVTFHASASGGHGANAGLTNWSFGDGSFATGSAVSHTYASAGTYEAVAHLADAGQGNASEVFGIVATAASGSGPALYYTITPAVETQFGPPIEFSAGVAGDHEPYQILWSEPGQPPAGSTPFSAYGPFSNESFDRSDCYSILGGDCTIPVGVTALNASGATVAASPTIDLSFVQRASALTVFGSFPSGPIVTALAANGTMVPSGMPAPVVLWNYGDGSTGNGTQVSHDFPRPGNFTVTATTVDPQGDRFVRSFAVAVVGPKVVLPQVLGGPDLGRGLAPLSVRFSVVGSGGAGGPYSFNWSFGDGANGAGANVSHEYTAAGNYVANVTVRDSAGHSANGSFPIFVEAVTPVEVGIDLLGSNASSATVNVSVTYACGTLSVLNCSSQSLAVELVYSQAGTAADSSFAAPAVTLGAVQVLTFPPAGSGGHGNATIRTDVPLPSASGSYDLSAVVIGPNFTGQASIGVSVGSGSLFGVFPPPPAILAAGVAVGLVVGVLGTRRRRADDVTSASP